MMRTNLGLAASGAVLAAVACILAAGAADVKPPAEDLVAGPQAGPWRRLFLDAMVVEQQTGLRRIFHAARKYAANPVVRKDREWEEWGPYLYGTVMWDQGRLRMWYHHYGSGLYWNSYAESADGITWTKPNLGLLDYKGSKDNNLIITRTQDPNEKTPHDLGQCHNPSVIFQPWNPDPQRRYALYCFAYDYYVTRVAFSPDGLHWTFTPETAGKGLFASNDVVNFFYDPYRSRYVATYKTANRRGRAVGVAESKDGLAWSKPVEEPVLVADDLDPDATQIYGMPVFPYQGLYIGQPWIYSARWYKYGQYSDQRLGEAEKDSPCTVDAQLAWSWDLINWTRPPERASLIPRGAEGEFDSGMIYTARAPVQVGDNLYFYYGGMDGRHNATRVNSAIGLAILRLDGFCSLHAGADEGWLISRREPLCVPKVTINAQTAADGYVVAELLDQDNAVIPGFGRNECVPFTGDAVRQVLTWKTTAFPEALVEADKKIRFFLKQADLYSYLPDPSVPPVKLTVVYDPGRNGGPLPDDAGIPARERFHAGGRPSGYRLAQENGVTFLDLHSVEADKTNACYSLNLNWDEAEDWCVEGWYRVADAGSEPVYGLATFMRADGGREAALYLSDKEVGVLTAEGNGHRVVQKVPLTPTDTFRWYRLVHTGGTTGDVAVLVDGQELVRVPWTELSLAPPGSGDNVLFGPNAAQREGRLHVARFGFRIGSTETLLGPVRLP
jgi:hypothetical protein